MEKNDKRFKMEERVVEWLARICSVLFFAFCIGGIVSMCSCDNELRKENERLREELALQQQHVPLEHGTIRDTVKVVTQYVHEVSHVKDVLTPEDRRLLKDLGIKVKELESLQKTGTITHDTVYLHAADSSENAPLVYHDAWTDFCYQDDKLAYSVRDSLAIAVRREYKKRFLWMKWGLKGYDVKVVNFNPHSTIQYNAFVKRRR